MQSCFLNVFTGQIAVMLGEIKTWGRQTNLSGLIVMFAVTTLLPFGTLGLPTRVSTCDKAPEAAVFFIRLVQDQATYCL
jgi:hypothetical protein